MQQTSHDQPTVQLCCPHDNGRAVWPNYEFTQSDFKRPVHCMHAVVSSDSNCILRISCGDNGLLSYAMSLG